ncbi:hypothetical protein PYV00_11415 [Novosphingobium sp. H3SJ31-1]|uniref:Uncharacterized protein n=1 Tax=Novosphingobium album (ex Liu et al. 2023) TaxID=3031130 RepID=A0ABT5WQJ8_9SPHN|nr:hypothetical protein [Novosphingobium album (ex Liu et al. 2023)]
MRHGRFQKPVRVVDGATRGLKPENRSDIPNRSLRIDGAQEKLNLRPLGDDATHDIAHRERLIEPDSHFAFGIFRWATLAGMR